MMWHERPENAGKVGRLKKMYRNTKNDEIMLKLNISFGTLHRTARSSGSARCSSRSLCFEIYGTERLHGRAAKG